MLSSSLIPRRPWVRARRWVLLRRRLLAAALVCAAAALGLAATTTPAPPGVPVVVAAADLPAGTVLAREDLRTARLPRADRPPSALTSAGPLLGRRLAVELRKGEPLGRHRLAGSGLAGAAPGLTTVPVRLADAGGLVRTGDRLDLLSGDGQGQARTLARGLPVLGTGGPGSSGSLAAGSGRLGSDGTATDLAGLVLVGVPATQVDAVLGASAAGALFFTFTP